jgi:hypothetical protein
MKILFGRPAVGPAWNWAWPPLGTLAARLALLINPGVARGDGVPPGINGAPGSFVRTWNDTGTLRETTNRLSGWTSVTTTSPYTNTISTTNQQIFFRVSSP